MKKVIKIGSTFFGILLIAGIGICVAHSATDSTRANELKVAKKQNSMEVKKEPEKSEESNKAVKEEKNVESMADMLDSDGELGLKPKVEKVVEDGDYTMTEIGYEKLTEEQHKKLRERMKKLKEEKKE